MTFVKSLIARTAALLASLGFLLATALPATTAVSDDVLSAQMIKTGLFVISGGGRNSILRLSGNGFILVDGKLGGTYDALTRKVQKLSFSENPIRALILTNHYANHNGDDDRFLAAGTRIVVQQHTLARLSATDPALAQAAAQTIVFADKHSFHLGGVDVQVFHFGSGRTDGDAVVYFPDKKVVALGDLYSDNPSPDVAAGGNRAGWGHALEQVLQLDFDVALPATGPPVLPSDVQRLKDALLK